MKTKKENIPAPVKKPCQWFRDIGSEDVDCFFKTFELLYLVEKTSDNTDDEKTMRLTLSI
jgi:hypothetical protein